MKRDIKPQGSSDVLPLEEFLSAMRQGKKTTDVIRMGNLEIPVRVLSCDEVNRIRREAIRTAAVQQGDETDRNVEIQKNTLMLATTMSAGGIPFLTKKHLELLSPDEMSFLYEEYIRFLDSVNPSLEHIDPHHFKQLVDALKKKNISPRDLSLLQLRAICISYVDLIQRQANRT